MEEKRRRSNRLIAKARNLYLKAKVDAEAIINLEPDPLKQNTIQLKTMRVPLKRKSDGAYPSLKAKRLEAYLCWKDIVEPSYEVEDDVVSLDEGSEGNGEDKEDTNEDKDDAVDALLDPCNVEQIQGLSEIN